MSEYQFVKFRALDRPLTNKQLSFMERQSSRAEFTKWEFNVEYHYSSFRGNVNGMLRNGYDIFLSYTNYGLREIRMRLPNGLPFSKSLWSKYIRQGLRWTADKTGKAGILSVEPYLEEAYDHVWNFDDYLEAAATLRELLIVGDLRALYVLWLCGTASSGGDDRELIEPPVPHGLATIPHQASELLAFFEADPLLVDASSIGIPAFNAQGSHEELLTFWITSITETRRDEIIQRLLSEDPIALKAELLSEIRSSQQAVAWPTERPARTVGQLLEICETLRKQEDEKQKRKAAAKAKLEAEKAEKRRQARMLEMKTAPDVWIKKASRLVEQRGTDNYREAASILADLRDAVGGHEGQKIAQEHAAHLAKKYPTLNVLKSSLRKQQLLN